MSVSLIRLDCDGPALIHCQSSKRRSGTFLAIEFALGGRERNGHIDSEFCRHFMLTKNLIRSYHASYRKRYYREFYFEICDAKQKSFQIPFSNTKLLRR